MEKHEIDEIVKLAVQAAVEQYRKETSRMYSIDEAAEMLGGNRMTIYRKMKTGELVPTEVFGRKKFSMAAIDACKKKPARFNVEIP